MPAGCGNHRSFFRRLLAAYRSKINCIGNHRFKVNLIPKRVFQLALSGEEIDDYRARRISDLEYLKRVSEIKDAVVGRKRDDVPELIAGDDNASALYGVVMPVLGGHIADTDAEKRIGAEAAKTIWQILSRNSKVGYWDDLDAQRRTMNEIDDYLYDHVKQAHNILLGAEEMDEIIEKSMQLARHRIST